MHEVFTDVSVKRDETGKIIRLIELEDNCQIDTSIVYDQMS